MYQVNETTFNSFKAAVNFAIEANADVIEVATGLRRWTPAAKPSAAKLRRYQERKAAYEAQSKS
jgi:hypothetical protein